MLYDSLMHAPVQGTEMRSIRTKAKEKPLLFVLPCNNYVHLLIQNASSNCGSAGSADNVIGVGVCAMARKLGEGNQL